uniref:(northern house mosquito) hypothetical protein n=1 Tax=Culex pipiens TaxID=7175 RepID=A0A8D8JYK0_CULPI
MICETVTIRSSSTSRWNGTPSTIRPRKPSGHRSGSSGCRTRHRPTPACSAWWSTRTKSCPSTPRRSWRSTKASSGTRCRHTSLQSQTPRTDRCCKIEKTSLSCVPVSRVLVRPRTQRR